MEPLSVESKTDSKIVKTRLMPVWFRFVRQKHAHEFQPWTYGVFALTLFVFIILFGILAVPNHPPSGTNVPEVELLLSGLESLASRLPSVAGPAIIQDTKPFGNDFGRDVVMSPTLEIMHETDIVWQIPDEPQSVLFLAHGCNQEAVYFFDHHPNCTRCFGMPEDRLITLNALMRNYAVIAIKSRGKCWRSSWPPESSKDISTVVSILNTWRDAHGLLKLPLVGIGASSGGYFLSILVHRIEFHAISLYISSGVEASFSSPLRFAKFPPTLFVHMPRDNYVASRVKFLVKFLNNEGIESSHIECHPLPISPVYFSQRIVSINKTVSLEVYGVLKLEKFLDDKDFLLVDPRASNWKDAFIKNNVVSKYLNDVLNWEKVIAEELNLAYALHEMTSLKVSETFDWFKNRCMLNGVYKHHRCKNYTLDVE